MKNNLKLQSSKTRWSCVSPISPVTKIINDKRNKKKDALYKKEIKKYI